MSQININPELLNKIDKIFSRVVEQISSLDKKLIHQYSLKKDEVGFEVTNLERELSNLEAQLIRLEAERTSLVAQITNAQYQINSININASRNHDERACKKSQISDLQFKITELKSKINHIDSQIASAKNKINACKSKLGLKRAEFMRLAQKIEILIQNSNIISLKSSDLIEKATKKISTIKNKIDGYENIRLSDSLVQNVNSTKSNSFTASSTTQATLASLQFANYSYQLGDISFSIDTSSNKAIVTVLPIQESFELKKRDTTLNIINKKSALITSNPKEYFKFIECLANDNQLNKIVVWVENEVKLYKEYGFFHDTSLSSFGVEMFKEFG